MPYLKVPPRPGSSADLARREPQPPNEVPQLGFTMADLQTIVNGLALLPYVQSHELIDRIQAWVAAQGSGIGDNGDGRHE